MTVSEQGRTRSVATILLALVAGGVAGAGVAQGWYGPAVGVGIAVAIGLAVGARLFLARREARRSREGDR